MAVYVITLEPDKILYEKIIALKAEVRELVGDQLYLQDEPHLTVYLGNFTEIAYFNIQFTKAVKQIVHDFGQIPFSIDDWFVFKGDPITKRNTLVCEITQSDIAILKKVQHKIVTTLNSYRKPRLIKRYSNVYKEMNGILKKNLDSYGYPFVGDIWKPHISIASIKEVVFKRVWKAVKGRCPKGGYRMNAVTIYELEEDTEKLTLVKRYPLADKYLQ